MSRSGDDPLATVFSEMSRVLDELFLLSQEKRTSVGSGDISRLESILLKEQDLMYRLGLLETKREEIQAKEPLSRERFKEHYDDIKKKIFSLKTINQENQDLIKMSLSIVQKELSILQPEESYRKESRKGPLVFDKKA